MEHATIPGIRNLSLQELTQILAKRHTTVLKKTLICVFKRILLQGYLSPQEFSSFSHCFYMYYRRQKMGAYATFRAVKKLEQMEVIDATKPQPV